MPHRQPLEGESVFAPLETLVVELKDTVSSLKTLEQSQSQHNVAQQSNLTEAELGVGSSFLAQLAYRWSETQKKLQKHLHVVQPALVSASAACKAAESVCFGEHATLQKEHLEMEKAVSLLRQRSASFVLEGWSEAGFKSSTQYELTITGEAGVSLLDGAIDETAEGEDRDGEDSERRGSRGRAASTGRGAGTGGSSSDGALVDTALLARSATPGDGETSSNSSFVVLETLVTDLSETLNVLKDLEMHKISVSEERTPANVILEREQALKLAEKWGEQQTRLQRHLQTVQPALVAAAAACVAAEHLCALKSATLYDDALEEAGTLIRRRSDELDRHVIRTISPARRREISPARARLPASAAPAAASPAVGPATATAPVQLIQIQQQHPLHPTPFQRHAVTREDREFIAQAMGAKYVEEDSKERDDRLKQKGDSSQQPAPAAASEADSEKKHEEEGDEVEDGDVVVPLSETPAPPQREQHITLHDHCSQYISADGRHVDIKCDCAPHFLDVLDANARASLGYRMAAPTGIARIGLAVVTCVDSRIDPLAMFGLECGDAVFLRNAGARVSDDVIRSLAAATAVLGITRIAVVAHSLCKMASVTQEQVVSAVIAGGGDPTVAAAIDFLTSSNQEETVRQDVIKLRTCPAIRPGTVVAGFYLDLQTSVLKTIDNGEI